jgi:hypothetical protein
MKQPSAAANLGQQYLRNSDVQFYVQDALRFVARLSEPQQLPALCDYWCSIVHGEHVVGRDFTYVTGEHDLQHSEPLFGYMVSNGALVYLFCNALDLTLKMESCEQSR